VLTSAELIVRADDKPARALLDPILPEAGNLMIFGPSGAGKSHLTLCVALALAQGGSLLGWRAEAPARVLYFDGEMPLSELKGRMIQYLRGGRPPDGLLWAAAHAQTGDMPDLADPAGQAFYAAAIEAQQAKVAIFDNLSCLRQTSAENPENSAEAWQPVAAFLRRLNAKGVATITNHHAAKSGAQRGSSAHTAVMDTVIRIAPPGEGQADPRADLDVELTFEKHRRFSGDAALPVRAKVTADADDFAAWELAGSDPLVDDVVRLRKGGVSVRKIAETLQRSKRGIEKALLRAKARGLLPLGGADE
jgi:putative DNA primase/helicase